MLTTKCYTIAYFLWYKLSLTCMHTNTHACAHTHAHIIKVKSTFFGLAHSVKNIIFLQCPSILSIRSVLIISFLNVLQVRRNRKNLRAHHTYIIEVKSTFLGLPRGVKNLIFIFFLLDLFILEVF